MFSHTQQNKPFYPTFNESRGAYQPPFQRPQTPHGLTASNLQPGSLNRSLNKLNTQGYSNPGQNAQYPGRNNISRSRVSMANSQASHLSNLVNEPDVFPE